MNRRMTAALAATMALALGGCATVLNGTKVDYTSETKPDGALVRLWFGMHDAMQARVQAQE